MKKLLIIAILILTLALVGCNQEIQGYCDVFPDECLTTTTKDYDSVISSLEQRIVDLETGLETADFITEEELRRILDNALAEFYLEIEDEFEVNFVITEDLKLELIQMLYNVLEDELDQYGMENLVDRVLEENGFYDAYNEEAYSQIQDFWQEMLLAVIAELEVQE